MTKEVDSLRESSRPERASVFGKRSAAAVHLKRPISSVDAIISPALPKLDAFTATSKNYNFRKGTRNLFLKLRFWILMGLWSLAGDRVKFVGTTTLGFSPNQTAIR